jgi:tRNA G18 (ribose-2'-O)-methylase SpoU
MFGEEQRGLSAEALLLADDIVYIPMRGSVRSFNVGTASGIAMYDYCMKTTMV